MMLKETAGRSELGQLSRFHKSLPLRSSAQTFATSALKNQRKGRKGFRRGSQRFGPFPPAASQGPLLEVDLAAQMHLQAQFREHGGFDAGGPVRLLLARGIDHLDVV